MGFLKKFTKQEISWMMYDWANSAHSVIVVTILPIFFDTVAGYTAEQVDAINAAAGPFGILSVILIIIVGAVLYFGVLPKVMTNDERKI